MRISSLNTKNIRASIKLLLAEVITKRGCSEKDCWIITERSTQARDNGYIFYKYLKEKHPEQEAYYIIDQSSDDYKKIKKYGSCIQFNSWKHYLLYCRSKIHISAHVNGCCPDYAIPMSRRRKKNIGFKDVFIPHGVSYGISEFCLKKFTDIDLFSCCGKPEYDNVLRNYGYNEEEVVYTGFPRLDEWHKQSSIKKQIFLMPTWRLYLAQNENLEFEKTNFYNTYQHLINNAELNEVLEAAGVKLIFYPHNEMRRFMCHFSTNSDCVEIVREDNTYDIQELLKDSALLITDYSSIHFDFAYMNKPVIYYQFDKDEFFDKQYKQSIFDAEKDGFGPVVVSEDALINTIKQLCENDFKMSSGYHDRMRCFYELHDDQNCERVYRAIIERFTN